VCALAWGLDVSAAPKIALLGAPPAFERPLHVAQVNLPPWDKVETAFKGIFERYYFANHGPLVRKLDDAFAETVGVEHAVCVTNGTVALMLLARALELSGAVIMPSFTFPAAAQALVWAGLRPVFCDVDRRTQMITAQAVEPLITPETVGVLGTHLWGRACHPDALADLCERRGLKLFFDACHAIACTHRGRHIGCFGSGEAFSFHATKVLNAGEGGCITTNDAKLADRLRTMRSFHGSETFAPVPVRFNGKMSEAQAALALLSLDDLAENIEANKTRYRAYVNGLAGLPGISVVAYDPAEDNNYQYVVIEVEETIFGLTRDQLLTALQAENVLCRRHFYPGVHRLAAFTSPDLALPNTDFLINRVLQVPTGQAMSVEDVERVCQCIRSIWAARDCVRMRPG
jgi:dTDP-4-amino-4,6-dideoxygalactose transaminase